MTPATYKKYSIYQEILSSQYISRSGLTIAYAFYNYTGKAAKFDCGIAIEDADGNRMPARTVNRNGKLIAEFYADKTACLEPLWQLLRHRGMM